jgi:Protein of Unknown function (DUF2784)
MGYRWLVDVVVAAHFAFLGYLVLGGFLAWRWPRAVVPHLLAAGWGLLVITFPVSCPLTAAENWARVRAGERAQAAGFIDRYVENVLYPERYSGLLRALVALVVLGSYLGAWRLARRRAGQRASANTAPNATSTTMDTRKAQAS